VGIDKKVIAEVGNIGTKSRRKGKS